MLHSLIIAFQNPLTNAKPILARFEMLTSVVVLETECSGSLFRLLDDFLEVEEEEEEEEEATVE